MALTFTTGSVQAQNTLPDGAHPMIVTPHEQEINYRARTLCYDIPTNIPFEVTSDQDWVRVRKGTDGMLYVNVDVNYGVESRTANIVFSNAEKGITQTFVLTQRKDESFKDIPADIYIKPSSGTANASQSGAEIAKSYDGSSSTIYHSPWSGFAVSESKPIILTYNFTNVAKIDYINYVPRQDGNSNGNFGKVEVQYQLTGQTTYTTFKTYDWNFSSSVSTVDFSELGGLVNPKSIRFRVLSGSSDFASCAEMQFYALPSDPSAQEYNIFADNVYSKLRDDVTMDDVKKLTNPMVKSLAMKMIKGEYPTEYRVADYKCYLNPTTQSQNWNSPGKLYDQLAGVTGINISKGTHAVVVSGIPEGMSAQLKVVAWYVGKIGSNFDGGNPAQYNYALKNGINIIEYTDNYDGLAYIAYYSTDAPTKYPDIKVHFVNGEVNGYLSPDKTNEEMYALCSNAKNTCMDVYGNRVHSIWTSEGLRKYCKAIDGVDYGYRQYMNVLDSIVQWQHDLLGLTKYGHTPDNRTMAYVNYTYYMFQGGYGVSFHVDQERRVLNCKTIVKNDNDAIWGLGHEWGHQHQMQPYFCWKGVNEVSNNLFAYYDIMKMGYRVSDKINAFPPAIRYMIDDDLSGLKLQSSARKDAYNDRSEVQWNADYYAVATAMKDSTMTTQAANKYLAPTYGEIGGVEALTPFVKLYVYFMRDGGKPDFAPDWYEALRQTDKEGGSTVEKTGGYDKYELVAAAQNGNKNGAIAKLKELFPASVWNQYITTAHCGQTENAMPYILNLIVKASRISGFNLFPYFERWGFLRQTALKVNDYGTGWQILTPAAYDEFKADMDELVVDGTLQEMPEGMVETISRAENWWHDTPNFPN